MVRQITMAIKGPTEVLLITKKTISGEILHRGIDKIFSHFAGHTVLSRVIGLTETILQIVLEVIR